MMVPDYWINFYDYHGGKLEWTYVKSYFLVYLHLDRSYAAYAFLAQFLAPFRIVYQ